MANPREKVFVPSPLRSADEYERSLNPNGTLPEVGLSLISEDKSAEDPRNKELIFHFLSEDRDIGIIVIEVESGKKHAFVREVEVYEAERGKEYGKAGFLELVKFLSDKGIRLRSGDVLSRNAAKIWEWMVAAGVARKVRDEGVNEEEEDFYTYSLYEII